MRYVTKGSGAPRFYEEYIGKRQWSAEGNPWSTPPWTRPQRGRYVGTTSRTYATRGRCVALARAKKRDRKVKINAPLLETGCRVAFAGDTPNNQQERRSNPATRRTQQLTYQAAIETLTISKLQGFKIKPNRIKIKKWRARERRELRMWNICETPRYYYYGVERYLTVPFRTYNFRSAHSSSKARFGQSRAL